MICFAARNIVKKSSAPCSPNGTKNTGSTLLQWAITKNLFTWNNTFESTYLLNEIHDNVLYSGFFQSEEYFKLYRNDLFKLLEIKPSFKKKIIREKEYLFSQKYIAVHIRHTDYLLYGREKLGGPDMRLPVNYYKKCLAMIKNSIEYNIIFVSDDIEFARKEFGNSRNFIFENNDEITDFQILLNADIIIIANSSFSWWAAWLNQKTHKQVFAPRYYLGFKVNKYYPAGIKVEDWTWVDVH